MDDMKKQKILIVDDSEMNRMLLSEILEGQYEITEAENGVQAIEILGENEAEFWLVLLDIAMPELDGFGVLNYINKRYWNDRVVVMMISSDDSPDKINRAYNLGAFDYISRPFDPMIVRKRIANTMFLYDRQHDLEKTIQEEFYEHQKNNDLLVSILSHIVEFRNGESGMHIQNVKTVTEQMLRHLVQMTDQYRLSEEDIALISMTSAMHDVGKVSIPEEILNKPGKLTPEEFEIMKTHSEIGARMISELPPEQFHTPLAQMAYQICRWHHERYDGGGYPDGLKGEQIPIAAQVVALADVYEALTSERCYKRAFSHEEALDMILEGKCGVFNPVLLQCLTEISDKLKNLRAHPGRRQKTERSLHGMKREYPSGQPGYIKLLYCDSLTEAYNRRYYKEYIRDSGNIEAVALVDVDGLKQINGEYGQETGDLVLRRTAQTLLGQVRRTDYLIRYGGDEFLIAFSSMTKEIFAARLEKIRHSFDTLTIDGAPRLHVSVSVCGVYGAGKSAQVFRTAEDILKQSKYKKRQATVCFIGENEEKM